MTKLQGQNEDLERIKASYEQDPYKVYTIEDLVELSNRTNNGESYEGKFVALMNDLDFQENKSYEKYNRTDYGDINGNGTVEELKTELTTGQGFMPIGKTQTLAFKGIFEGKNNTIQHLYIDREMNFVGLLGNSNTIQNLTIKDGYVRGRTCTGAVVGALRTGKIENCHNVNTTCILREGNYRTVGGVVGQASSGTEGVINCTNSGTITDNGIYAAGANGTRVGGVLGYISNSQVSGCSNTGNVTGQGSNVGGVAGIIFGTVEKCYNTGTVTQKGGPGNFGGIVGSIGTNCTAKILNCYNTGKIIEEGSNENGVGGIIGWVSDTGTSGEIRNNYSIGEIEITGTNVTNVGGAIGRFNTSAITMNYNYYELNKSNVTLNNLGEGRAQADMKTQAFLDLLNTNQNPTVWDFGNINNGYPILKWQK